MSSTTNLRLRRSEAQLQALAGVQREIRTHDSSGRRKYLQEFTQAFRSYESVIDRQQTSAIVAGAGVVLIGDYHALPGSQRFAASLLEERAQPGDRPVVLGVETIFSRDQHILGEWWRREIDEGELRQRIRFDLDWGYDWVPFYELLVAARENGEAVYGLDCMPREDLRKIGARDRHAAHKIGEIRLRHPNAVIFAVFGESHLAPEHLPRRVREELPEERVLTVLQNVDALYWQAAGEKEECVEAVRVSDDVVCAFTSTPLEKYENYRLYLTRLNQDGNQPDVAPTVYNLIDSLLKFLDINRYSSHNGTQPKFLVDLMPEIYCHASETRLRRMLANRGAEEAEIENLLNRVEERGSAYLPQINAFYMREFQMMYAAEEAARFLHHACRGLPSYGNGHASGTSADRFYSRALEHALGYFGSRVLYPARGAAEKEDAMKLPHELRIVHGDGFDTSTELLGYMLGNALYDAYLKGHVSRAALRRLFLAHLEEPGTAKRTYKELAAKLKGKG